MKIAMIVLNSVWHDPRVRREATSSIQMNLDTVVIGLKDSFFKKDKVDELPFKTILIEMKSNYYRQNRTLFTIIKRELIIYTKLIRSCVKEKPDIIHANDLNALPVAYIASKIVKSKIVYDCHEIFIENECSTKGWRKNFWFWLEKFLIKRTDQIISVSNSSASELSKMYGIQKPIVITNCVFKLNSDRMKTKAKNHFEILYQGKFYKGRGYDVFIKAAEILKNYEEIKFVLRGYGELESELRDLIKILELQNKVYFDDPVDVTDLVSAASSSHVGVVLTEPINKNFINTVSNKLFEYINAGLPVILSNLPEHKLLNDKYKFGIVLNVLSPEALASAIQQLFCNKELYTLLTKNVQESAKVLNWENEYLKLYEVYNRLYNRSI